MRLNNLSQGNILIDYFPAQLHSFSGSNYGLNNTINIASWIKYEYHEK